jgi:hypothetical protein
MDCAIPVSTPGRNRRGREWMTSERVGAPHPCAFRSVFGPPWVSTPRRSGSHSLGEFPLDVVRIECERCGRAGSFRRDGLMARFTSPWPICSWRWLHCERRGDFSKPCVERFTDLAASAPEAAGYVESSIDGFVTLVNVDGYAARKALLLASMLAGWPTRKSHISPQGSSTIW